MWWVCMNISEEHAAFIIHQERRWYDMLCRNAGTHLPDYNMVL
jgi:hypothetical protein